MSNEIAHSLEANITPSSGEYEEIIDRAKQNPKLHQFLISISGSLKKALLGAKSRDVKDFLSKPEIFSNNVSQYNKFIDLIGLPEEWENEFKAGVTKDQRQGWTEEKKEAYDDWLEQDGNRKRLANQKLDESIAGRAVANQKLDESIAGRAVANQEKQAKDGALAVANQEFINTISDKNASIDLLLSSTEKEERNRFIKDELSKGESSLYFAGKKTESFGGQEGSSKYLESIFYLQNATKIRARLENEYKNNPDKQGELAQKLATFDASISELSKLNILRDITPKWREDIEKSFPPTESRGSAIREIERYNTKDTTIMRDGTSVYMIDRKNPNEVRRIEINGDVSTMALSRNGLSISRNIEPLSKEKKELEKLKGDLQKITEVLRGKEASEKIRIIAGVDTSLLDEQLKEGKPDEKQSLEGYKGAKKSLNQALAGGDSTEKLLAIQKMKEANRRLDETRTKMINPENMNNPKQGILEDSLWREQESLTYLETLYKPLIDKSSRAGILEGQTKNEGGNEDFENRVRYNLNFLTYIGYDTIGQDNMERVIRTLNSSENPKRSEIGEINLNEKLDTLKTQALTLAIANLVRAGRKENIQTVPTEKDMKNEASQQSWDDVDKTDPIIAARQTQSLGFRESLLKVKRNMMNEGGSLKTDTDIKSALL